VKRITTTILKATLLALALVAWPTPNMSASAQTPSSSFEIVHFVETRGRITNTQNAFDTSMYTHYAGTGTLTVNIILYDEGTGLPIPGPCGATGCDFTYGGSGPRRRKIHFEDLCDFTNQNQFLGVAFITLRGDAASTFVADTYLINSRQSAFDLSYVLLPLHPLPSGFRR
jgi:hypothetical protein